MGSALKFNGVCVAAIALMLIYFRAFGSGSTSVPLVLACVIAAFCVLVTCWRAAQGDDGYMVAAPVTGILLEALLGGLDRDVSGSLGTFVAAILIVTLGVSIFRCLAPSRPTILVAIVGIAIGWIGVSASLACVANHLPVFSSYIAGADLLQFNPLGVHGTTASLAEQADRIRHNAANTAPAAPWVQALLMLQVVAGAAWDALLLSVGVWVAGALALLPLKLVGRSD